MKERREFVERFGGEERPNLEAKIDYRQQARHAGGDQPGRARGREGGGRAGRASACASSRTSRVRSSFRSGRAAARAAGPPHRRRRPPPAARRRHRPGRRRPQRRPTRWPRSVSVSCCSSSKAKTPASMPSLAPESIEQALATQAQEGGRLGEILVKMRAITEEEVLQALGHAAGDRLQRRPEGRRRRRRSGDVDPDRLRQAAPAAGGQARGGLRDGGDGRSAGVGALDDLRMQLGAEVQPVLVPPQRILEVINDVYGRKARQGRRPRREGGRGGRGRAARSWSTSSRSPTRRRSSAGSTRCCSTRSRSGPAISTSSRARRRSSSATASTASSTRRGAPRASSCRRSSRA